MGINMPEKESEGTMFENALSFYSKDKEDEDVRFQKLPESNGQYEKYINENIVPDYSIKPSRKARPTKDEYYLNIAKEVSSRGTCLRRRFGAIIVKNDTIVSTGYVGAPRHRINCCDRGTCFRMEHNIPSGQRYELCRSSHAEMNAIIFADPEEREDATMYLVGVENDGTYTEADCCSMCKRVIINSGISKVVFRKADGGIRIVDVNEWIKDDDSLTIHEGY